jgi:hypothetical protein
MSGPRTIIATQEAEACPDCGHERRVHGWHAMIGHACFTSGCECKRCLVEPPHPVSPDAAPPRATTPEPMTDERIGAMHTAIQFALRPGHTGLVRADVADELARELIRLRSPLAGSPPTTPEAGRETAWLIERGNPGPTHWWCDTATSWGWTTDATLAIRFASRADAEAKIAELSGIAGVHEPFGRATEHVFLSLVAKPSPESGALAAHRINAPVTYFPLMLDNLVEDAMAGRNTQPAREVIERRLSTLERDAAIGRALLAALATLPEGHELSLSNDGREGWIGPVCSEWKRHARNDATRALAAALSPSREPAPAPRDDRVDPWLGTR